MPGKKTETKETPKVTSKVAAKDEKVIAPKEETKKVESKGNKSVHSSGKDKVVVETVVDNDSSDEDFDDSDGSENEGDAVKVESSAKEDKEKKLKKSYQELADEWDAISTSLKVNETEHKSLLEQIRTNEKQRNELERSRNRTYAQMGKSHDDEVKKATKNKPKRKGNKEGGFNKEQPVPPKLVKYLGLEEGIKMARPKVMSALNEKFKTDGLKSGQTTTLDKDSAKALGKEKGRVIEFTAFQSFLKEFYEEAFPPTATATVTI